LMAGGAEPAPAQGFGFLPNRPFRHNPNFLFNPGLAQAQFLFNIQSNPGLLRSAQQIQAWNGFNNRIDLGKLYAEWAAANPGVNPALNPALSPSAFNPILNPALNPRYNPALNPLLNPYGAGVNPLLNPYAAGVNPLVNPYAASSAYDLGAGHDLYS